MRAVFEAVHQDFRGGARFVNAWHAEGAAWAMSGEDEPRVRFWGTSIDMHLNWNVALVFADGECFSWRKVGCINRHCQYTRHLSYSCCCWPFPKSTVVVLELCKSTLLYFVEGVLEACH